MHITWLGHAAFELRFATGEVLLMDPWLEGNPKFPKGYNISKVDGIAISHGHFDHINDVIPLAKRFQPKVVGIVETTSWLERKGVQNTIGMNKGGTVDLNFVKLSMTHALHSNAIKDGDELVYGGEAAGYVLHQQDGRSAYFAGDTSVFAEMNFIRELYKPELAFLPIGDHYTMGPKEAALAARMLQVKKIIPMHYGTFPLLAGTPDALKKELAGDGLEVWQLQPGEAARW